VFVQDAASRNAMAGQEEVSQGLTSAQARIKVLEANVADAHATVWPARAVSLLPMNMVAAVQWWLVPQQQHTLVTYVCCLVLHGAQVMSQSQTISDQARQLDAARMASGQEVSASEARVRALQQGARSATPAPGQR
jgi:hypothetical protein